MTNIKNKMLSVMKIQVCLHTLLVASAAAYTNSPLFQKPGYAITVPTSGQRISKYGGSSTSLNMMEAVNAVLPSAIFLGGIAASISLEPDDGTPSPKWVTDPWIPPQMPESLGGKKMVSKKDEAPPAVASAEETAVASTTTEETAPTKVDEPKKSSNIIVKTLSLLWRIFQKMIAPWRKWESIA